MALGLILGLQIGSYSVRRSQLLRKHCSETDMPDQVLILGGWVEWGGGGGDNNSVDLWIYFFYYGVEWRNS